MKRIIQKEDMSSIAGELVELARSAHTPGAKIITLSGELGAGKTTLTQELSKILGIKENLISPTFVIMKSYKTADPILKNLVHIDAYRLEKSSELENLGFREIAANPDSLIIIEWPERVPECTKNATIRVHLEHIDEEKRSIEFSS